MQRFILIGFICTLAVGCATGQSSIGMSVLDCCAESPAGKYTSFDVEATNMPVFLEPLMLSNFSVAFSNQGFQPQKDEADLHVVLNYQQENLATSAERDDFGGQISPGEDVRFLAKVVVSIYDNQSRILVWAGTIQRIHTVGPGEYMHTGRASVALLEAFEGLLKDFSG